jgi:tryptophan 2,3-dioxygenase
LTDEINYGSYLKLDELLALQHPQSTPEHPDELLFIVVHQASELWFKLIRHELGKLSEYLVQLDVLRSLEALNRVNGLMGIVTAQLHALDTLSPQRFAQFRTYLGTSSGSQSIQFRSIELLSGLRDPDFLKYIQSQGPLHPTVQAALDQPSLPELFAALLKHRQVEEEQLYATDAYLELRMLAEGFLAYDQAFGMWRFLHVQLVERILGPNTGGTGGSLGAKALRDTLTNRFFPGLWEVRAKFFKA